LGLVIVISVVWILTKTPPCNGDYKFAIGGESYFLFTCDDNRVSDNINITTSTNTRQTEVKKGKALKNTILKKVNVCFTQPKYDWSKPYQKAGVSPVGSIRCGSKDVKDPNVCGFSASLTIPIIKGDNRSGVPLDGQEKYIKTASNSCSPANCCHYDMDNKETPNHNGNYLYSWRHRSCSTTRSIAIEVKKWVRTGADVKICNEYSMEVGNFFEFNVPSDALKIKLYPLEPEKLPPEKIQNEGTLLGGAYKYECSEGISSMDCVVKKIL